jgi:hypothetical protein
MQMSVLLLRTLTTHLQRCLGLQDNDVRTMNSMRKYPDLVLNNISLILCPIKSPLTVRSTVVVRQTRVRCT